jgi:hypothetical protein
MACNKNNMSCNKNKATTKLRELFDGHFIQIKPEFVPQFPACFAIAGIAY